MKKIIKTKIDTTLSTDTGNSSNKSLFDESTVFLEESSDDTVISDTSSSGHSNFSGFSSDFDSSDSNGELDWKPVIKTVQNTDYERKNDEFYYENIDLNNPFDIFKLFFTEKLLNLVVKETNLYALKKYSNGDDSFSSTPRKHEAVWTPVTIKEMKTFFGIIMIMGLVKLPRMKLYWSKNSMYGNKRIKEAMKRDRFLKILKYLHFSSKKPADSFDRLYKIQEILDMISMSIKDAVIPGQEIVIDESMIPWRGRLLFRVYIPGKRHKYGVKLYKLCLPGGYTYALDIYTGRNLISKTHGHSYNIVMNLMDGLLLEGRTLYTDNFYTSIPLAEELLNQNTFICGTVRANRKFLPSVKNLKQKRGEIISAQNCKGVKFMKWTDKRPVQMLTTCLEHSCSLVEKNGKIKPDLIFDYNN